MKVESALEATGLRTGQPQTAETVVLQPNFLTEQAVDHG